MTLRPKWNGMSLGKRHFQTKKLSDCRNGMIAQNDLTISSKKNMKTTQCPSCSAEMEIPDHYLNKKIKCTGCSSQFEASEKVETSKPVSKTQETKFCRECGAEISKKAVVCPKCGVPTEVKGSTTVIEETSKKIKAHIIIGAATFFTGFPIAGIGISKESGWLTSIGIWLILIGFAYVLVVKFIQWWKHK